MSNTVDNRIVEMKFEHSTFESGVNSVLSALDKLSQKLRFDGSADKGLTDVQRAVDRFHMGNIEGAVTGISKSFLAMSTIAITALSNIVNRATDAGIRIAKSLSVDPLKSGFQEYQTGLNSVQTILANTTGEGIRDVNKALDELNEYSDKTIYNFGEMAKNIGTFTAAGVGLDESTNAIKGIANLAAVSGSNSQQASTAMYQLSQALAAGKVSLMDWNSVVNAGMGGKVFQKALTETARTHGVAVDKMIKETGSFRASISEGWITSDILTETLSKFTGDLTDAQLKSMGYSAKQIKQIQKQGDEATDAATKVKTASQLLNTLQEAAGSGWAQSFEIIFGNFNEAKELFTNVNDVLSGMIGASAEARNKVLGDWKKAGGRTALIDAISNSFTALMAVLKPIREAFRDIFPAMTGQRLADLSKRLRDFTETLTISDTTADNLRRTFRGVFAIFSIIGQIIGGVIGVFADLAGAVGDGSGGFLDFTGGIGDFLVSVDQALKKGQGLSDFFDGLGTVLQVPIDLIQVLAGFIVDLFDGADSSGLDAAADSLGGLADALTPVEALGARVSQVFGGFGRIFSRLGDAIAPVAAFIKKAIQGISDAIDDAFSGENFDNTLDLINTGLFAGLLLIFRNFAKGMSLTGLFGGGKGGLMNVIQTAFGGLTDTLGVMQANVKANTLLKIAGAVALLTVSIVALSLIDSEDLTKAMSALAVGFGQLLAAMFVLEKIGGVMSGIKMPFIAASMILMAGALVILAAAVKIFSTMDWDELTRGLAGTAGSLVAIAGGMRLMPKNLPVTGAGLILVGAGLAAVAGAMKLMAMMEWKEIGKGLGAIAGALTAIAIGMNLMPVSLPVTAAGLILVGAGLSAVAGAMKIMNTMSWKEIGKGLGTTAAALIIIAGAMHLMPLTLPITAAGLVLVGAALTVIAGALKIMGKQSWEEIGKGLATLAGALAILAVGLNAMTFALPGAAALVVAAGALAILTPILVTLGKQSWENIAKGLLTLAGAFTVIGVAGLLLTPVIPALLGLGVALTLIGAGLALAGAAALAFAAAFGIVVAAGGAGAAVMTAILDAIIEAIPKALKAFGQGLVQFAKAIATGGPQFTKAFVAVLSSLLDAVIKVTPKIGRALTVMIQTGLRVIRDNGDDMIAAGLFLLISLLEGIEKNIGKIVRVVSRIIVNFINALGDQLPKILDAGAKFIIKFINGLADTIRDNSDELGEAGGNLATAIIEGMVKGIGAGVGQVVSAAKNMAKSALNAAKNFLGIKSPSKEFEKLGKYVDMGFAKGIVGGLADVDNALNNMKSLIANAISSIESQIEEQKGKIEELKKDKKATDEEKAKAQKALETLEALRTRSIDARKKLRTSLQDEQKDLRSLGRQYDQVVADLEAANSALETAIKNRDDFASSTASKFNVLPEIDDKTTVESYLAALQQQNSDVAKFKESLDTLRNMGMDEATYRKFLDEGVGIQPFVDELIASGPAAVAAINGVDAELATVSAQLGTTAATHLYQAGVDAAQGLVDGLESKKSSIEEQMRDIAKRMIKAIRKQLKSKSPSREMMDIARDANDGLAIGLRNTASVVSSASKTVANTAIDTMRDTLSGLDSQLSGNIDVNPVITPVLDLTQVNRDAQKISDAVTAANVTAGVSFEAASSIAAAQQSAQEASATTVPTETVKLELTQINQSPEALDDVSIYRQTKSLFSLTKEALDSL